LPSPRGLVLRNFINAIQTDPMSPPVILLVSGNLPSHLAIRGHLTEKGYLMHCPESVAELNTVLDIHPHVDFVIFSSDLPGLEGLEPLSSIRQTYPHVPIMLLMSQVNLAGIRLARMLGCNEVIMEPIDPENLDTLISRYLPSKIEDILFPIK
jgi:CheY-like chemotaxis protein